MRGKAAQNPAQSATDDPGPAMPDDPDLRRVVRAWPALPPAVRAGIVAMVGAVQ